MSGTFDGITIPEAGGLDVGHLFQSFIKSGTSFKLIGKIEGANSVISSNIIVKIPIDGTNLFESGYSVDDLLIGKVGIIGICKGKFVQRTFVARTNFFKQRARQLNQ